ncbi:MAG: tetratricopeptide repeat protein [Gammaproteobacteria bacterium]
MNPELLREKLLLEAETAYEQIQYEKAEKLLHILLQGNPDHTKALAILAKIQTIYNRDHEAIASLERLILLEPNNFSHFTNLGMIYQKFDEYEKSQVYLNRALELKPDSKMALMNLGCSAANQGDFEQAIIICKKALEISPDWVRPHYNLALAYIALGRYEEGWREYEYRLLLPEWRYVARNFATPKWDGVNLKNKTILIYAEQNFGDIIHFARFLSLLKRPDNTILLEFLLKPQMPLLKLLQSLPWIDKIVPFNHSLPIFDYHASLMSLPYITKCNDKLSNVVPYIFSIPEKKAQWQEKLAAISKPTIGLCWLGNSLHSNNRQRSCSLAELLPYLPLHKAQFINLTKECTEEEKRLLTENNIINYFDDIHDFSDTAALIDNLDLVISVDTAVGHLSGAMNKPVWLMVPHVPEWRYMQETEQSHWYPSMKIFKQKSFGAWYSVFASIQQELKQWLK